MEGYFINNVDDRIAVHGRGDCGLDDEFVCFDIETTGLKVDREAITEIGAVVLKNGEICERFQTFVNPNRRLTPEIIGLTGITDEMLKDAPQLKDALTEFLKFVNGRPLAAHNAEFDIGFIRAGCKKVGLEFDPTYVDSLILARTCCRVSASTSWTLWRTIWTCPPSITTGPATMPPPWATC